VGFVYKQEIYGKRREKQGFAEGRIGLTAGRRGGDTEGQFEGVGEGGFSYTINGINGGGSRRYIDIYN